LRAMAAEGSTASETAEGSSLVVERSQQDFDVPKKLRAKVVHGFGRGSKTLGFPTANMEVKWDKGETPEDLKPEEREILEFARTCKAGIYYAWAQVADGPDRGVYKTAMSVGWNPTFTDVKVKTIEPWILHDYGADFYDCELRLVVCGYVRDELKFEKFDELIKAIREDGEFCSGALETPASAALARDAFFAGAAAAEGAPGGPCALL